MLTFITGFIASIAHVVTGPDHLAAVTPLAIDSRKKSWIIGFSWGLGHTIGMLLIGLLFVLFKEILPVEAISAYSETTIGILLIAIGCWALIRIYRRHSHGNRPHAHFHSKPYLYAHIHKHSHDYENSYLHDHKHVRNHKHIYKSGPVFLADADHGHNHENEPIKKVKQNALTALLIGIIHGFAGFSHLFALLPSLAFPSRMDSLIYISAFALGTILTMVLFAFILGLVAFRSLAKNKQVFLKWFTLSGAILAIAVGILWIVHPF